MAAQKLML